MAVDFDLIYRTDLTYVEDCWKLSGDGHCCTFGRYKARFSLIGSPPYQQLPLLPGEYEYLVARGLAAQFKAHEHRRIVHRFGERSLTIDLLVGREAGCLCRHEGRTTICRLYPLLPVFDDDGRLSSVDLEFGSFEMLENLAGIERACRIERMPLAEVPKLLAICAAIAADPPTLFRLQAYRLAKQEARAQLLRLRAAGKAADMFKAYEMAMIRGRIVDWPALDAALESLATRFERRYGAAFSLQ